jgi:hypothetical protein
MPAVYLRFQLSPIVTKYTISYKSFHTYLLKVFEIVGGIFIVTSIIESFLRTIISVFGFKT